MAQNKKYYYLKLKEDFFFSGEVLIIEKMPEGMIYSNILLKLYLLSLKFNGFLKLNDNVSYSPIMLSSITGHQVGTIEKALELFLKLGLIIECADSTIYMANIEDMVGTSSTEADRKRLARAEVKKLGGHTADKCPPNVLNLSDIRPPEIEIEKETEIKKELESERELYGRTKMYRSHSPNTNSLKKIIQYMPINTLKSYRNIWKAQASPIITTRQQSAVG